VTVAETDLDASAEMLTVDDRGAVIESEIDWLFESVAKVDREYEIDGKEETVAEELRDLVADAREPDEVADVSAEKLDDAEPAVEKVDEKDRDAVRDTVVVSVADKAEDSEVEKDLRLEKVADGDGIEMVCEFTLENDWLIEPVAGHLVDVW
jgi:hypothetical protein